MQNTTITAHPFCSFVQENTAGIHAISTLYLLFIHPGNITQMDEISFNVIELSLIKLLTMRHIVRKYQVLFGTTVPLFTVGR